jgi:hypothetical protein
MAEQKYIRESVVRGELSAGGAAKCCAYNQTRERFLCADIETGDFAASNLDTHLPSLTPGCNAGLWMIPFRGISPTSVRVPIDLIYLDRSCVVIETVESFPLFNVSSSSAPAASVLALPANTVASVGTRPGDRLILCPPDEMKARIQQILSAKTAGEEEAAARSTAKVLQWVDRSRSKPAESPAGELPAVAMPLPPSPEAVSAPESADPAQSKPKAKSWLQKLLSPDAPQPRKAQRESIQGLAAFFFNGGQSLAHGVRDISPTGFYVLTTERWYPGTVIRMTLTDSRQPTAERSITVNGAVVRWGNDGVGLQFILQDEKSRSRASLDGMMGGASKAQIEQFIRRLKNSGN